MNLTSPHSRKPLAALVALAMVTSGCGLDQVAIPGISGPSETGISIQLLAYPDDVVLADGIDSAGIQAVVRNHDGTFASGREVLFTIADEAGRDAEIGTLTGATGQRVFGATTMRTNAQGIAQVIYTSPERRDLTANVRIIIAARVTSNDANGAPYTTMRIELRSAEPRRFPQGSGTITCSFNQAPNNPIAKEGTVLRFSSTSTAAAPSYVVRYEWYFGDGTSAEGAEGLIDVQKPYPFAGTYTVTHIVTNNFGQSASCNRTVTIVP